VAPRNDAIIKKRLDIWIQFGACSNRGQAASKDCQKINANAEAIMIRVCVSMLLLVISLTACATGQTVPDTNAQQTSAASSGENILACTGLPVAGQKCGLALPKL
jgi:hypothetical protein